MVFIKVLSGLNKNMLSRIPSVICRNKRFLNLHEYQCKNILKENGLNVQRFGVAANVEESIKIAKDLNAKEYVVKAQILAGGRGKGVFNTGYQKGVHLTTKVDEVAEIASNMLGNNLITKQTTKEGVKVVKITVSEALDISSETYVAVLLDRQTASPVIVGSPCGGMDIEEVAKEKPDQIFKEVVDINTGPTKDQCVRMAKNLGFSSEYLEDAASQIHKLYDLLIKLDATQVEINPFGLASNNKVVCFDSKISFDDNAKFRQEAVFSQEDLSETPLMEIEAKKSGLEYIQLDGNIGCLVNGAGLAMSTLDLLNLHGGSPANFLDLGGGANTERVLTALKIFSHDTRINGIFINIFGGIIDCTMIANGLLNAASRIPNLQPIVLRLEGTNVLKARELINKSGNKNIHMVDSFDEAAQLTCAMFPPL